MQGTTPARVGYGQGFVTETEPPRLTVRIRSGTNVGCGGYVGNQKKPVAFVWMEEEAEAPEMELVVRVDFDGIYLWHNGTPVSLVELHPNDKTVYRLNKRFADWQRFFGKYYNPVTPGKFYWGRFHEEGRRLARELQAALIDKAVIRYRRPMEDPQSQFAPEIEL